VTCGNPSRPDRSCRRWPAYSLPAR
jgi:hypothetical protein